VRAISENSDLDTKTSNKSTTLEETKKSELSKSSDAIFPIKRSYSFEEKHNFCTLISHVEKSSTLKCIL